MRLANISPWFYVGAVGVGIFAGIARKRWKIGFLVGYMLIVFSIAVLSRDTVTTYKNLELFRTYHSPNWQVYANILAFIPIGFLISSVSLKWLWIVPAFSGIIEGSQLIMRIGMLDVDDIVSNCIGAAIGVLAYLPVLLWTHYRMRSGKKQ